MRDLGGWGTWVTGHMGKGAHGHNFFNTAWILKFLLDIDIDVFYLNVMPARIAGGCLLLSKHN